MGSSQELDFGYVKFKIPIKHQNGDMRNDNWMCASEVQERGLIWRSIYMGTIRSPSEEELTEKSWRTH